MKKKLFVVFMVMAMIVAPVFAGEIKLGDSSQSITSIGKIITLCTGVIPGALIAIKFMVDVVSAYYHREQDPSKLSKAIVNFAIVVIIIIGYVFLVNFIFSGDTKTGENSGNFLSGLTNTGAEVDADAIAPSIEQFDFSGFDMESVEGLLD